MYSANASVTSTVNVVAAQAPLIQYTDNIVNKIKYQTWYNKRFSSLFKKKITKCGIPVTSLFKVFM